MSNSIKRINPSPHSMNHLVTAIVILAVIIPLGYDLMDETESRLENADYWCNKTFSEQYRGLGNVQSFVDGGAHCMLKNNTWIKVPENLSKEVRSP